MIRSTPASKNRTAKTGTFASVAESLASKARKDGVRTVEEMKAAVKSMARKRMERSKE